MSSQARCARAGRPGRRRLLAVLTGAAVAGCSMNPATGQKELNLVSESQEIAMGLQAAQQVATQMGGYTDTAWQGYVSRLGLQLAAKSERPQLPWHFTVVDDPQVNAFALPGGQIYITRGILANMNSEAELAGVLGHEIGHVTARHSATQMSRAQLAQLGLGLGTVLRPDLAQYAGVVSQGLGKTGNSAALSALADSLRNKKRVKPQKLFTPFAPGWYQFFPEHMPPAQMAQMAGVKAPGYAYPQPRGFRR